MELFIHLKNPKQDAVLIKETLQSFDCSVTVENEKVVITTSSLVDGEVDLSDNTAVSGIWDRVKEFINIINGSSIVEGISKEQVVLDNITYEDCNSHKQHLNNIGNIHIVLPSLTGGKSNVSELIPLALKDNAVAKVLRLCSRELDWVNMYRIYEVVQEDMGRMPNKELKVLKGMANLSSVSGDEARHGKLNVDTPKKTMHLADAQHLIKKTISEWLHSKLS